MWREGEASGKEFHVDRWVSSKLYLLSTPVAGGAIFVLKLSVNEAGTIVISVGDVWEYEEVL